MTTVADIVSAIDHLAPWRLAEEWDNPGLMLGDLGAGVRRILVSLDVSERVCDEAERIGADLLLAHHPLFYKPMPRLTSETRPGRLALRLASQGRAVIAAHTNLDAAEGGLCDILAEMVGLGDLAPLRTAPAEPSYKIVVFVPESDLEAVRAAAFAAGAGHIGHYSECGFTVEGTGTFLPGDAARPSIGEKGRRNEVRERRLEVLADGRCLGAVVAAIGRAHSYEEPAIDVYPLHGLPGAAGVGRVGRLVKPISAGRFADKVKRALGIKRIALAGRADRAIQKVAVVTGGGGGLVESVLAAGCNAYLTGELKHHEVEDLAAAGIAVILGGHWRTERVPMARWVPRLAEILDVEVLMSQSEDESLRIK